ncbi:MAG: PAS domain S-box protein [Deltaproteobacteria bacterium]|nr:PAS domain S-box protein [Deltaproteobacteria bacterium]
MSEKPTYKEKENRVHESGQTISDYNQTEEILARSSIDWQTLFDAVNDSIWILDDKQHIVLCNKASELLFQRSSKEMIGRPCWEIVHGTGQAIPECPFSRSRQSLKRESVEIQIAQNWFQLTIDPILNSNGKYTGAIHVVRDISQRKKREKELMESEMKYRSLFEKGSDLLFIHDLEGNLLETNLSYKEQYGFDNNSLIHMNIREFMPDRYKTEFDQYLERIIENGEDEGYMRAVGRAGKEIILEYKSKLMYGADGKPFAVQGSARDVTRHLMAEKALEDSEERFKNIFHNAKEGISLADVETRKFFMCNQMFCDMFGYDLDELKNLRVEDLHPREDLHKALREFESHKQEKETLAENIPCLRSDGTIFYSDISVTSIEIGRRKYNIGFFRDVTERKMAEQALHESEEKYRKLFEEARDCIILADPETGILVDCNNEAAKLVGRDKSELIGQHQRILHPSSQSHAEFSETFQEHLAESEGEVLETQVITSTGEIREVSIKANLLHIGDRKLLQGIFRDITYSKQAEEAIRESERKYRTILESIEEGYYESDLRGNLTFFNDSMCKISGYARDELMGMNSRNYLPPKTALRLYEIFNKIYQTGKAESRVCHELIKKDGSNITVEASASLIRDSEDKPVGFRGIMRDITEENRIEAELIQTKVFLENIFDNSAEGIITTDLHGNIIYMSPRVKDIFLYNQEELIGKNVYSFYQNGQEDAKAIMKAMTEKGQLRSHEIKFIRRDGRLVDIHLSASLLKDETGEAIGTLGIYSDITDEKRLKAQFLQAQKMEAIGTLAGGVAHDFNNILTTIIGNCHFALNSLQKEDPLFEDIEDIKKAGERAARLTSQLLAFSRKQLIQRKILDINEVLTDMGKMISRLIGENIEMSMAKAPDLWRVEADPGQIEQIVMNLVVNAKDAMPLGGKLTIETANVVLDEDYLREHGIMGEAGNFVMFAISDNGIGMDKEIQEHIFEPFFTSKASSKGTGLGLSTVYGIVKQNRGYVFAYSEPAQGSSFKVYLPGTEKEAGQERKEETAAKGLDGSETVLIVEDDSSVRKLLRNTLKEKGYKILEAENGENALRVSQTHDGSIDLILTDVVMPKMNGTELAKWMEKIYPHVKVIFMSGYTDDAIVKHGILPQGQQYIQKPFTPNSLVMKVREALNKKG